MPSPPAAAVASARTALDPSPIERPDAVTTEFEVITAEVALAHDPTLSAAVLATWMTLGVAGAWLMARRGHDFPPLAGLAILLGPLFAGFVVINLRPREQGASATVIRDPSDLGGDRRVVVVLAGQPSADPAAHRAVAGTLAGLPSGEVGRVEVVRPTTYETADGSGTRVRWDRDVAELERVAAHLDAYRPGLTLVPGTHSRAIGDHLEATGAHVVLVVGDPGLAAKLDRGGCDVRPVDASVDSANR